MSIAINNNQVNQLANSLPQQNNGPLGMTHAQAEDLMAIAKMAYGSREGAKGGEGYIGAFADSSGKVHLAKLMTHWSEYKGVKGKEADYLNNMSNAAGGKECAETLRGATTRLCDRLIDIARAVGKEKEVAELLQMKQGDGGKTYPPLLSRKIAARVVETIAGSDGKTKTDLTMRSDALTSDDSTKDTVQGYYQFDWETIGKSRAKTIDVTSAKAVVEEFANKGGVEKSERRGELSNLWDETPLDKNEIAYFECIKQMKGEGVTTLSQISSGLVNAARKGQSARLERMIEKLDFDPSMKQAYGTIMSRMTNLRSDVADCDKGNCRKFQVGGNNMFIGDGIDAPFTNEKAKEAFFYMLKKDLRKCVEDIKKGNGSEAPITPRELEDFMFKASCKAFICATALDALFVKEAELEKKLNMSPKNDESAVCLVGRGILGDSARNEYESMKTNKLFGDVAGFSDTEDNSFSKDSNHGKALEFANIKRHRMLCAMVPTYFDNAITTLMTKYASPEDKENFVYLKGVQNGEYYDYDTEPGNKGTIKSNVDDPCSLGVSSSDSPVQVWGELLDKTLTNLERDTLLSTTANVFNQGVTGFDYKIKPNSVTPAQEYLNDVHINHGAQVTYVKKSASEEWE